MATDLLLTFAVEETLKKLGSIVIDELTRIWALKKDLKKLRERSGSIQAMLQQVEDKQTNDEHVKRWLVKLQDVVYSADDVLDEFSYEILRRKTEIGEQLKRKIRSYLFCGYNPGSFRREIAKKVKEINKTLANIEKQAISEFALKVAVGADHGRAAIERDQMGTHSLSYESKPPVGRVKELKEIITFMEAKSSSHNLKFVCIVGFGGLGKTTLAKMVYATVKTKKLFDVTMWIDVSKTSSAIKILGEMLQKVEGSLSVYTNIDTILECLREKFEEKTFLLVLDNVWNKEDIDWLNLEKNLLLISKRNGNSVIMTTRIIEMANIMDSSRRHPVKLQELSDDECWSIIKGKAFGKGEESAVPRDLQITGFDIAKKCKGVPLVAEVLGGTLRSNRDTKHWKSIRDSNVLQAFEEENILSVLRLSFDHLRSPLKQCFAYCSLFRKNFVFEKEQVIQLWMAEGFLDATSRNATPEEIGGEYFDELWVNSFFQNVEVDKWGNIISCKMHDLVHDLAMSISNKHQDDGSSSYKFQTDDCRRVSFFFNNEHQHVEGFAEDKLRKLRSLHSNRAAFRTLADFKSLRSLNLYDADCKELSSEIGELKHLRYLDISMNSSIEVLPESIRKLYNLQTLRVLNCQGLKELPRNIGNLVSLRHIHFYYHKQMPFKVGSLTNLRTLPLFVVGQEEGYKIQELKHLNELRGKLKIFNLEQVRNGSEAVAANLGGKKLSKLRLTWQRDAERNVEREGSLGYSNCNQEEVLEGLQPFGSIISLTIKCYMGKQFPEWKFPLDQLAKLKLFRCDKCEIMPTLGHLPRLKILQIEEMENVRCIRSEFYGERNGNMNSFPALEKLKLYKMKSLEEFGAPDEQSHAFPCLQELVIEECSLLKSISLSHLSSLKRMNVGLCPKLISLPIGLMSLEDLSIFMCEELESISSSQDLGSLKHMEISNCKLTSLPMGLRSLEDLDISECKELKSISSSQDLVALKHIRIRKCPKLTNLQLVSTSLEELDISKCEQLESISSSQDLVALKRMRISECLKMTFFQLGSYVNV